MNLRDLAQSHTVTDGALAGVTFWLIPYKTTMVDVVLNELREVDPPVEYVHADGRRQTDEPDDYKAERERVEGQRRRLLEKASAMKSTPDARALAALVIKSDWQRVYLWGMLQNVFALVEPLTVAIDFPDMLTQEAAALKLYWDKRPMRTADRWHMFRLILGADSYNQWVIAHNATRDNPAPAAPELAQETASADPKDGEASTTTTNASRKASAKRSPTASIPTNA